jgi:hypothetical protein
MFTQVEAKRVLQKIEQSFMEVVISHGHAHTLHPRGEWASSDNLRLRVPVGNPTRIGLDLPLTALVGITRRRRKILTYT